VSTWCWLALTARAPSDAAAVTAVHTTEKGPRPSGFLALWTTRRRPTPDALRADRRLLDPNGEAALVSLVLPPPGVRLPFDDLAVQHARRRILAEPFPDLLSTLLSDDSHFEGAISGWRGAGAERRASGDPFARVFPARTLHVGAGLLGRTPPPAGPTIERYGSVSPWPWDRFT
jgi:hypothetical protein